MLRDTIIRAWKDPEFRYSLSSVERAELPDNPAGAIELTDEELDLAVGGQMYNNGGSTSRRSSGSASSNICNIRFPPNRPPEEERETNTFRTPRQRASTSGSYKGSSPRSSGSYR